MITINSRRLVTKYDWTKFKTECRLIEHKEEQND